MPAGCGPCGESIARTLDARDFLARVPHDTALLEARLRLSPAVVAITPRCSSGNGWQGDASELRLTRGFAFAARVDLVGAELAAILTANARRVKPQRSSPPQTRYPSSRRCPGCRS